MRRGTTIARLAAIFGAVALFLVAASPAGADWAEQVDWSGAGDVCTVQASYWPGGVQSEAPFLYNVGGGWGNWFANHPRITTGTVSPYTVPQAMDNETVSVPNGTTVKVWFHVQDCDFSAPIQARVERFGFVMEGAESRGGTFIQNMQQVLHPCPLGLSYETCRGLAVRLDINTPGTTRITYWMSDLEGNVSARRTFTLNVRWYRP